MWAAMAPFVIVLIAMITIFAMAMDGLNNALEKHEKIEWHTGPAESLPVLKAEVKALQESLQNRFTIEDWKRERNRLDEQLKLLQFQINTLTTQPPQMQGPPVRR